MQLHEAVAQFRLCGLVTRDPLGNEKKDRSGNTIKGEYWYSAKVRTGQGEYRVNLTAEQYGQLPATPADFEFWGELGQYDGKPKMGAIFSMKPFGDAPQGVGVGAVAGKAKF